MFVVKNAWRNVIRNRGRNVLIALIVLVIAAAATIGLSIRQAAASARESGLNNTKVTAQISLDRSKLISAARSSSNSSGDDGAPDFSALRSALENKELKLSDYEKYAKASSVETTTYYSETTSVAKTDDFQPVETTSQNSNSSSSGNSGSGNSDNGGQGMTGGQGGMGGGFGGATTSGDFSLVGFSSDAAVQNASNGSFTMSSGKVFGYDSDSVNQIVISESLADFNNLKVGDSVIVANASDSGTTYKLKVVGIYQNATDSSSTNGSGPQRSGSSDPANAIYTSTATLKKLKLDSSSTINTTAQSGEKVTSAAAQLSYTYSFADKADYETFVKDVKAAGLSSDYTVSSPDVEEYEASLVPLDNLSSFALTLLLIVLGVGAVVLVVLNLFNVRERKYEIGVLTAIGVRKSKVAAQFALELLIVTMIGLGIGVAAGAATSVPVSNQLLSSQVAAQQAQTTSQRQQFGRDASVGSGQQGAAQGEAPGGGSQGAANAAPSGGRFTTRAVDYVSTVNATVNLKVVGQMVLIGLGLTLASAMVGLVFVMRYEPLQILADRS